jgi:Flp pilus assembly protein TadD
MRWNVNPSREEIGFLMEASLIYRDSGRFAEARQVLDGIRALLPHNETASVMLGTVSLQEADFDGAARQYKQALDLNPRSAHAFAHLGELEILRLNKEQATQYLKEAIRLDPRGVYGAFARNLLEFGAAVQSIELISRR